MKTLWVLMMLVVGTVMADINNPPVIDASWQSNKYSQVNGEAASNLAASAKTTADLALPKAGGTMSGVLDMGGNSITNIGTNSIVFMDGTKISSASNGVVKVGSGTNLNIVVDSSNIQTYAPTPPTYFSDGITIKKVGTTFSVADWIPENLVDLYVQFLVEKGATSRGMLDGPGYLFNDTNGILPSLSVNQTFLTAWYHNLSSTNVADGTTPISQWKMNDNAGTVVVVDSIGTNNGTAQQNTSVLSTNGKINSALTFNGTTDKITLPPLGNMLDFSISVWVKHGGNADGPIFASVASGTYLIIYTSHAGNKINAFTDSSVGAYYMDSTGYLGDGAWHHIVLVRDTGTASMRLYMDGIDVGVTTINTGGNTDPIPFGSHVFTMGDTDWGGVFAGALDDVRLYASVLSTNEITNLYNNPSESTLITIYTTNSMSLVCTNKLVDFLPTATWMSILASGTGLTTTDVQGYVSPDYGTNWYQATLTASDSIDLSNTLFQGSAFYTNNTTGSNLVLKAVTTSNKVVNILGMWGPSN